MSQSLEFYRQQADICGLAADAAKLENQRDILLKSQRAWQALADRLATTVAARAAREGTI